MVFLRRSSIIKWALCIVAATLIYSFVFSDNIQSEVDRLNQLLIPDEGKTTEAPEEPDEELTSSDFTELSDWEPTTSASTTLVPLFGGDITTAEEPDQAAATAKSDIDKVGDVLALPPLEGGEVGGDNKRTAADTVAPEPEENVAKTAAPLDEKPMTVAQPEQQPAVVEQPVIDPPPQLQEKPAFQNPQQQQQVPPQFQQQQQQRPQQVFDQQPNLLQQGQMIQQPPRFQQQQQPPMQQQQGQVEIRPQPQQEPAPQQQQQPPPPGPVAFIHQ